MTCTVDDVRAITGSPLADIQLQPFVDAASCIIDQVSGCAASISDSCKDNACTYLAAHLLTTSAIGQGSALTKRESLRGKYTIERAIGEFKGSGVLSTSYGSTANMMLGGCLQELDLRQPSFSSVGADYDNTPRGSY